MIPEEAMTPAPEPPELDEGPRIPWIAEQLDELDADDWPEPELAEGTTVALPCGTLTVLAVVAGRAFHHGKWLYEVTPVAGQGRRWVSLDELDAAART